MKCSLKHRKRGWPAIFYKATSSSSRPRASRWLPSSSVFKFRAFHLTRSTYGTSSCILYFHHTANDSGQPLEHSRIQNAQITRAGQFLHVPRTVCRWILTSTVNPAMLIVTLHISGGTSDSSCDGYGSGKRYKTYGIAAHSGSTTPGSTISISSRSTSPVTVTARGRAATTALWGSDVPSPSSWPSLFPGLLLS